MINQEAALQDDLGVDHVIGGGVTSPETDLGTDHDPEAWAREGAADVQGLDPGGDGTLEIESWAARLKTMDFAFMLQTLMSMHPNAILREFSANMDPSKKFGWPEVCPVLLLWFTGTKKMQKKLVVLLMDLMFVAVEWRLHLHGPGHKVEEDEGLTQAWGATNAGIEVISPETVLTLNMGTKDPKVQGGVAEMIGGTAADIRKEYLDISAHAIQSS